MFAELVSITVIATQLNGRLRVHIANRTLDEIRAIIQTQKEKQEREERERKAVPVLKAAIENFEKQVSEEAASDR